MTEKHRKQLAAAAIVLFVLLSLAVAWFVGGPLIRSLRQPEEFRLWVSAHGSLGRLVFVGIGILQIVVAIIPGEPIELFAGYAFGFWVGTLLCELCIVLGSALVFAFVRRFGRRAVEVFFPREKIDSLRFLQDEQKLELWTFILFFIPGTPKDIMTYFVPLTRMKLGHFLLISGAARLPSVITSTIGGDALGTGRLEFAVIVFAATALISALGIWMYRRICRRREKRRSIPEKNSKKGEKREKSPLQKTR